MEAADVNGGNAEVAREESNLENVVEMPELKDDIIDNTTTLAKTEESSEVNGDIKSPKKKGTPVFRRKLRKFKANSTSDADTDAKPLTRGQKRKPSDPDEISSEDSAEFNGFDSQVIGNTTTGTQVLQKLIAEAESAEVQQTKRRRLSISKSNSKNFNDDTELGKSKMDGMEAGGTPKIKKEIDSNMESPVISNSLDTEQDPLKMEESNVKSGNFLAKNSPMGVLEKLRVVKVARGISPAGGVKTKVAIDMTNPLFREPFKYGWKRELVFRAGSEHAAKRMADIYYYTPKGKKVRSFREVAEYLNTKELTIDNFTFFKDSLGVNNPELEIIRDAKVREPFGPATPTPLRKTPTQKRPSLSAKKTVDRPLTPPQPAKNALKSPKVTPSGYKIKLPAKKGSAKKEIAKSPTKESEMRPPQWNSPARTRRNQPVVEKTPPAKTKRVLKVKLQEPCSIRCSTSIPSLQCTVCLCLYHPECIGDVDFVSRDAYVCKNCHEDSSKPHQHPAVPPPPPLIPISMIAGIPTSKTINTTGVTTPKHPRLPKFEGSEIQKRATGKTLKKSKSASPARDGSWLQAGNEYLHSHDGTIPKPAQNIALMAGKRYIVVPKNNAMAVQPAVTVKQDKIGDKAPKFSEVPHSDNSSPHDPPKPMNVEIQKRKEAENPPETIEPVEVARESDEHDNDKSNIEMPQSNKVLENNSNEEPEDTKSETNTTTVSHSFKLPDDVIDEPQIAETRILTSEPEPVEVEPPIVTTDCNTVQTEKFELNLGSEEPVAIFADSITLKSDIVATDSVTVQPDIIVTDSVTIQPDIAVTESVNVQPDIVAKSSVPSQLERKKKQPPQESDQRRFMDSVCAGYNALSRIFQYLKVQELLRAARVCKMWRDLAAHPALWKTVRMKNSQVTDWDGFADSLKRHGTQHLDLRKMLVAGEADGIWKKFVTVVPRVTSLVRLELCRCPVMVVEEVIKNCPQLEILSAMSIKCDSLNLESVGNLKHIQELRLKAISGMSLQGDLTPLQEISQLTQLSLTSVKELGKKKIDIIGSLVNLETLELGDCSDFPDKFGTEVLLKLQKLERLRLEKGQGTCCTFDILEGVSKLQNLNQLELVNFDVKNGFDKCLANCKYIKRLLIIPTYISQSATSNHMVLGGVTELHDNLTHFVWGVTLELLRVTELFVDQCNQTNKQVSGDSIPVLKPVPGLKLIEDVDEDTDPLKVDEKPQPNLTNPQVDILPLPKLQKLLLTALPKTRVKILKIPFHATWRQSISDTTTQ